MNLNPENRSPTETVKETHTRAKTRMGRLFEICLIILGQATNLYFFFQAYFFYCPTFKMPEQCFNLDFLIFMTLLPFVEANEHWDKYLNL